MNKSEPVKIISQNQFEINVGYLTDNDNKKIDYAIDIYFFIPKNLGINEYTYLNSDFYNDYISYIRLITPKKEIKRLVENFEDLIDLLDESVKSKNDDKELDRDVRMCICSYTTYLNDILTSLKNGKSKPQEIKNFLKDIKQFSSLKEKILPFAKKTDNEKLVFLSESAAEYISLVTQHYLFEINIYLKSFENRYADIINSIVLIINEEIMFCKKNEFPIISSDDYENESVIYRYSVFKKYFQSVLFFHRKRKEDGAGLKELYYAIAAGISMVFTTLIVFFTQQKYGNLTMSLFAALVVSYMFKDRIKEAYRHYFDKRLKLKVYDFKEKIYDSSKKFLFGFVKEKVRFIKKDTLDKKVISTRLRNTTSRLSTWYLGENIIKYEKNIIIYNKNLKKYYVDDIEGLRNVMRFDISRFLKKMKAQKVPLYRIDNSYIFGDKVYHVNLVVRLKTKYKDSLYKIRLVLTKKGIKRIELPDFDKILIRKNSWKKDNSWFSLKKSGLLKKI
jgi:hypothetical protein